MSVSIKPSTGSGPNKKVLAYIATNDPGCGKEFKPGLCRVRHIAAKLREARGNRHEYEPCAYCPHFTEQLPDQEPALCLICGEKPQVHGYDLYRRCRNNPQKPEALPGEPSRQPNITQEAPKTMTKTKTAPKSETCNECQTPITAHRKNTSGLCAKCYDRNRKRKVAAQNKAKQDKTEQKPCPTCGKQMTRTGLCRSCAAKARGLGKRQSDQPATHCLAPAVELPPIVITPKKPVCDKPAEKVTQEKSNATLPTESNTRARWRRITQADIDAENRAKLIDLAPLEGLLKNMAAIIELAEQNDAETMRRREIRLAELSAYQTIYEDLKVALERMKKC